MIHKGIRISVFLKRCPCIKNDPTNDGFKGLPKWLRMAVTDIITMYGHAESCRIDFRQPKFGCRNLVSITGVQIPYYGIILGRNGFVLKGISVSGRRFGRGSHQIRVKFGLEWILNRVRICCDRF